MKNYYDHTDLERVPELARLAPKASSSFFKFELDVYHRETQVPAMIKELIAVAVAHTIGCPYCIDVHVQKYFDLGGTKEEIMEAVFVAASTRAGAVLSHATQALKSFESKAKVKDNRISYVAIGWSGAIPKSCERMLVLVPTNFFKWLLELYAFPTPTGSKQVEMNRGLV